MVVEENIIGGFVQGGVATLMFALMTRYLLPRLDKIQSDISEIRQITQSCRKRKVV
jgi:hypothetical protein